MTGDPAETVTGRSVPRWVVATAIAGTVLIALGAFWLSFTALTDLAIRAGVPAGQAWVWPLIVDGVILVATTSVVALAPRGRSATWYPWTLLALGAAVSVSGNAAHATIAAEGTLPAIWAAAVSAVPPLVLLAITHLTVLLARGTATPQPDPAAARIQGGSGEDAEAAAATLWSSTPDAHGQPASTDRAGGPDDALDATRRASSRPGERRARREEAAALRERGWSNKRIARHLDVHASTVGRWFREAATS